MSDVSSLYDRAEDLDRDVAEARRRLSERLKDGGKIGRGVTLRDVLECEFNSEDRFGIALGHLEALLTADSKEQPALCDQMLDGAIERFLDSRVGENAVTDEMESMESERAEA